MAQPRGLLYSTFFKKSANGCYFSFFLDVFYSNICAVLTIFLLAVANTVNVFVLVQSFVHAKVQYLCMFPVLCTKICR